MPALAVQALRAPLGAASAALWLLDADAGDGSPAARLAAQDGVAPDALPSIAVLAAGSSHAAMQAMREGVSLSLVNGAEKPHTDLGADVGPAVSLTMPLSAGGRVLGAVALTWEAARPPSAHGQAIVEAIAALAAQALTNAHAAAIAQEDHRRLVTTFDSMVDAVFLYDPDGHVVDLNEAGLRLLGLSSRSEAVGPGVDHLRYVELCHPDGRAFGKEARPSLRAVKGELVVGFEEIVRHLATGDERRVLINAAPVRADDGAVSGAVLVCHDVTALRTAERVKDEFLSVASHELKTPLTPLKGFVQIVDGMVTRAERGAPLDYGRVHRYLQVMRGRVDRLVELVGTMLDLSRLQAGPFILELAPVDLVRLTAEVLSMFEAELASAGAPIHRLSLHAPTPLVVRCDAQRIEQVVLNLVANALKFSPRGGSVRVRVDADEENALLTVQDEGIGIPRGEEARLFQPFARGSNAPALQYGGVGLGLYICREIVERHGGNIAVRRDPADPTPGATLRVTLPLDGPSFGRSAD